MTSKTRATNSAPLAARRQASVATLRVNVTPRRSSLSAQVDSAATARSIAASDSRPVCDSPSPSRTTREKASMTIRSLPLPGAPGRATNRRQLLVPRSIAPNVRRAERLAVRGSNRVAMATSESKGAISMVINGLGDVRQGVGHRTWWCVNTGRAALTPRTANRKPESGIAPSSKGKTTDSDSVYRGSNPRGASVFPARTMIAHACQGRHDDCALPAKAGMKTAHCLPRH